MLDEKLVTYMQSRLKRYKNFIDDEFIKSILWNEDYSLEGLDIELRQKIEVGNIKRIVFTGMGCSAIVSDVIKAFFINENISIQIDVVNGYDYQYLIDTASIKDNSTLIIISSYSGFSKEPVLFYEKIRDLNKNIVFLTSGGKLEEMAHEENVSLIKWELRNPDREYPLFHVPQYFSILLRIFHELKILPSDYYNELETTAKYLETQQTQIRDWGKKTAKILQDSEIVLLATPKWHLALLKLALMHLNEMSMVSAHRNYFHEFCHSEIAIFSHPNSKKSVLLVRGSGEDDYSLKKMDNLVSLIQNEVNEHIEIVELSVKRSNFFFEFFEMLLMINELAFNLGKELDTPSRELISQAAENPWYNQETIQSE